MNEFSLNRLKKEAVKVDFGYEIKIPVKIFKDPLTVCFNKIDKLHSEILSDLTRMGDMDLYAIKAALLFHYVRLCGLCDWGHGRGSDNPFKINSPDDAYNKTEITGVYITDPEGYIARWCVLSTKTEWENEHGAHIAIRNGIIHGIADDYDTPFPIYEFNNK